ncbi:MAG: hypothetical protein JWM80_4790 [Cyanobacteria bacterium RYN_339]|nr:hypothetical protein [Cyanobacteria bacterium RYN_339]
MRIKQSLAIGTSLWMALAAPSLACGGLFCQQIPVDQTGEKILFATDGQNVTAHVQIAYQGDAKSFSWIVPVPTPPKLEAGTDSLFTVLREATRPQFQLEIRDEGPCEPRILREREYDRKDSGAKNEATVTRPSVTVISQEQVGPYDTVVLQANEPGVLKDWLRKNHYVIPAKLDPLLDPYVAGKYSFVALKLTKDKAVGDIQPIVMTYKATKPGIPIRLTSVAAQSNMDVFVWVLGSERAIPENYRHADINEARIDWLGGGQNYKDVVTRAVDEAGGQAFVTDYAGRSSVVKAERFSRAHFQLDVLAKTHDPVAFAQAVVAGGYFGERNGSLNSTALVAFLKKYIAKPKSLAKTADLEFYRFIENHGEALREARITVNSAKAAQELESRFVKPAGQVAKMLDRYGYLTAMYTTMSPEEMTQDPTFRFNAKLGTVAMVRHADGVRRCRKGVAYEVTPVEITLRNGRKFTVPGNGNYWRGRYGGAPTQAEAMPAAARIEQLAATGEGAVIQDNTAVIARALQDPATPSKPAAPFNAQFGAAAGLLLVGGLGWRRLRKR